MKYSQSKVRYARDTTKNENDLSIIKTRTETKQTYFYYNYNHKRFTDVLVRIGSKLASFFGAKTISQNNLSNCLRHANAYFANNYEFTISQLLDARKTLIELKDKKNFGKYLESNKGTNDNERFETLFSSINYELEKAFVLNIQNLRSTIMNDYPKSSPGDFCGIEESLPIYEKYVDKLTMESKEELLEKISFLDNIYHKEQYKMDDTENLQGFVSTMKRVLCYKLKGSFFADAPA